ARGRFALARVLGRKDPRAQALARDARAELVAGGKGTSEDLAALDAWRKRQEGEDAPLRGLAGPPPALALAVAAGNRPDPRVERGRYLANGILQCFVCHSPRDESQPGWPPVAGKLGSGGLIWDNDARHLWAPNITPDVETGAGGWSDQVLADAITRG